MKLIPFSRPSCATAPPRSYLGETQSIYTSVVCHSTSQIFPRCNTAHWHVRRVPQHLPDLTSVKHSPLTRPSCATAPPRSYLGVTQSIDTSVVCHSTSQILPRCNRVHGQVRLVPQPFPNNTSGEHVQC